MTDSRIEKSARRGYGAGLIFTLLVAVSGQVLLGRLPEGQTALEAVRDFGYTLTGISLLGGLLLAARGKAILGRLPKLAPQRLRRFIYREYLAIAFACALSTVFGMVYWGLGGRQVERHARTFIALGPCAFLALAVRPSRWAAGPPDAA